MQLSVLPFVGLIVMHMYVGISDLHGMKFLCFNKETWPEGAFIK